MQWLNKLADEVIAKHPDGDILVSSGVSPSGIYHVGTLREVLTADAIVLILRQRGRQASHLHVVDDLDPLRKVPAGVPDSFEKYFGMSLIDVPSPDGKPSSNWADYYFKDFEKSLKKLGIDMQIMRSHKKYQAGFFVPAIEAVLERIDQARQVISEISGRQLDEQWSPIQIKEENYLKSRKFLSIDPAAKTVEYEDKTGAVQQISYAKGEVKLYWRLDWPARWWLLGVDVEPFGRDHATKGGSYDTGVGLMKKVFGDKPPLPVPYNFINRTGQTKKMSKSSGDTLAISDMLEILPPEVLRYFVLRYAPDKLLFFDETDGVIKLIDDFAELLAKPNKTAVDELLIEISLGNIAASTISNIPFSHLVASYQAALKDPDKTLEIIGRTEHKPTVDKQREVIKKELKFIDNWLKNWAPDDIKFELLAKPPKVISEPEREYLAALASKIAKASASADGEWFHKAIYEFKDSTGLAPKQLFSTLYKVLIGQEHGPRAGWFLSILPRDWLLKRLKLEV
ncbi:MAG TPA: lysine--tRNA ligase [Candidatus Saccharimonadales bacterium]|nr:lysine--tRNA ligase [Candidatus Saccharimonadales bacterium]